MRLIAIALIASSWPLVAHAAPDEWKVIAAMIRERDLNCAEIKSFSPFEENALGQVAAITCGPEGKDSVYAKFWLTLSPRGRLTIIPQQP